MDIDGSNPKQLYFETETLYIPTWSPDSKYIVTVSRDGIVIVINIDKNIYTKLSKTIYISPNSQLSWAY
jgi:Tol biopolymer transport system component